MIQIQRKVSEKVLFCEERIIFFHRPLLPVQYYLFICSQQTGYIFNFLAKESTQRATFRIPWYTSRCIRWIQEASDKYMGHRIPQLNRLKVSHYGLISNPFNETLVQFGLKQKIHIKYWYIVWNLPKFIYTKLICVQNHVAFTIKVPVKAWTT